jgi:hypothetical protein
LTNFLLYFHSSFSFADPQSTVLSKWQEFLEIGTDRFSSDSTVFQNPIRTETSGFEVIRTEISEFELSGLNKNRPDSENVKQTGF